MMSAGLVDRAIDEWETKHGRSTVKNTVSALVLVLDEAVREGIIARNPAKDRARRRTVGRRLADHEPSSPRELALPDVSTLELLAERVVEAGGHQGMETSSPSWRRPRSGSARSPGSRWVTSTSTAGSCTSGVRHIPAEVAS